MDEFDALFGVSAFPPPRPAPPRPAPAAATPSMRLQAAARPAPAAHSAQAPPTRGLDPPRPQPEEFERPHHASAPFPAKTVARPSAGPASSARPPPARESSPMRSPMDLVVQSRPGAALGSRAALEKPPPPHEAAVTEVPFAEGMPMYEVDDVIELPWRDCRTSAGVRTVWTALAHAKLNVIQSHLFEKLFHTDENVVISSPTGSGKTVLFELAILRMLKQHSLAVTAGAKGLAGKVVYLSPLRALSKEKHDEWVARFGPLGVQFALITGESQDQFPRDDLVRADVIVTTPEKWDSITRRWHDNIAIMGLFSLILIDEVHILGEERGASLEAVVSRMKAVSKSPIVAEHNWPAKYVRVIALSATLPNLGDVAWWLEASGNAISFDSRFRPVPLQTFVYGHPTNKNPFFFEKDLLNKVFDIIKRHSSGRPTLVFCNSRTETKNLASLLSTQCIGGGSSCFVVNGAHAAGLDGSARLIEGDTILQQCLRAGVGYHSAGMSIENRHQIEKLFESGSLPVLCTTSTLAIGVNLPAHLVIIKSTQMYHGPSKGYMQLPKSSVLQMMGRAGRPQFDSFGVVAIMTSADHVRTYSNIESLVLDPVESCLPGQLNEIISTEIAVGTIGDVTQAIAWLRLTFFYRRIQSNPSHYHLDKSLSPERLSAKLRQICLEVINRLVVADFARIVDTEAMTLTGTVYARIMSKFCLKFPTALALKDIEKGATLESILHFISNAAEFSDTHLRKGEKSVLNELKKTARFKQKGKVATSQAKIFELFQAGFASTPIDDWSLSAESHSICAMGSRIASACYEFLSAPEVLSPGCVLSLVARKCMDSRCWEQEKYSCRQLVGVGDASFSKLTEVGLSSLVALDNTSEAYIEKATARRPPFGKSLKLQVQAITSVGLQLEVNCESVLASSVTLLCRVVLSAKASVAPTNPSNAAQYPKAVMDYTLILCCMAPGCEKVIHNQRISGPTTAAGGIPCAHTHAGLAGATSSDIGVKRTPKSGNTVTAFLIHKHYHALDTSLAIDCSKPLPFSSLERANAVGPTLALASATLMVDSSPTTFTPAAATGNATATISLSGFPARPGHIMPPLPDLGTLQLPAVAVGSTIPALFKRAEVLAESQRVAGKVSAAVSHVSPAADREAIAMVDRYCPQPTTDADPDDLFDFIDADFIATTTGQRLRVPAGPPDANVWAHTQPAGLQGTEGYKRQLAGHGSEPTLHSSGGAAIVRNQRKNAAVGAFQGAGVRAPVTVGHGESPTAHIDWASYRRPSPTAVSPHHSLRAPDSSSAGLGAAPMSPAGQIAASGDTRKFGDPQATGKFFQALQDQLDASTSRRPPPMEQSVASAYGTGAAHDSSGSIAYFSTGKEALSQAAAMASKLGPPAGKTPSAVASHRFVSDRYSLVQGNAYTAQPFSLNPQVSATDSGGEPDTGGSRSAHPKRKFSVLDAFTLAADKSRSLPLAAAPNLAGNAHPPAPAASGSGQQTSMGSIPIPQPSFMYQSQHGLLAAAYAPLPAPAAGLEERARTLLSGSASYSRGVMNSPQAYASASGNSASTTEQQTAPRITTNYYVGASDSIPKAPAASSVLPLHAPPMNPASSFASRVSLFDSFSARLPKQLPVPSFSAQRPPGPLAPNTMPTTTGSGRAASSQAHMSMGLGVQRAAEFRPHRDMLMHVPSRFVAPATAARAEPPVEQPPQALFHDIF